MKMEDIMAHRLKLWLVVVILVAGLFAISLERAPGQNKSSATVTPADYLKWRNEFKNWGRWGADDQRGASNLITAEKSLSAARLVKNGIVISLAHAVPQQVDPEVPAGSVFHRTGSALATRSATSALIDDNCSPVTGLKLVKSNRSQSSSTFEPCCCACEPKFLCSA